MTHQLDLLGLTLDESITRRIALPHARNVVHRRLPNSPIDVPRAALADPETSHIAAARIRDSGALGKQQQLVLDAVRAWPGLTSAELAAKLAADRGVHWSQLRPLVARRLPELATQHVRRGVERVCVITGSICVTWRPL